MIVRRCSQGHRVRLHRNTTKGLTRVKTYPDGTKETLTYPSSYDYFVDVDGEIKKKSNSFKVAEEFYVSECAKKHGDDLLFTKIGWIYQYNAIPNNTDNQLTNYFMKKTYEHFYGELNE